MKWLKFRRKIKAKMQWVSFGLHLLRTSQRKVNIYFIHIDWHIQVNLANNIHFKLILELGDIQIRCHVQQIH